MWKITIFVIICLLPFLQVTQAAVITYTCNIAQKCEATSLTALTQPNEAITVTGQAANYVNVNAKGLIFNYETSWNYFPTGLFTTMPSLEELNLNRVTIVSLLTNAFGPCGNLNILDINNGNIQVLVDGFAQQCSKLTRLNMERDGILSLHQFALKGLSNLKSLVLGQNSIPCIPPDFFKSTPKLTDINLVGNRLTVISEGTFANLPSLTYVALNGNQLTYIPPLAFSNIPPTGFAVDVSNNPFYAVSSNFLPPFFADATKDLKIRMSGSKCTGPYGAPCTEISKLNYQTCQASLQSCYRNYTTAMTGIAACPPVAVIECQFTATGYCFIQRMTPITLPNQQIIVAGKPVDYVNTLTMQMVFFEPYILNYFPTNFFKIFPNTVYVTLYKVQMRNLVPNAFGTCGKVGLITMTNGNIPYLVSGFAQGCSLVKSLNMNLNNIQAIEANALIGLNNLEEVYFSDNNITCIHPNLFLNTPKIHTIFFRRNKILAIDRYTFSSLVYLKNVDFQSNSLKYLQTIQFPNTLPSGFKIDFSYNQIYAINPNFIAQFYTDPAKVQTILLNGISCYTDPFVCGQINPTTYSNCNKTLLKPCYANYAAGLNLIAPYNVAPPCNAR